MKSTPEVSVSKQEEPFQLHLHPNPASGKVVADFHSTLPINSHLEVHDIAGRVVLKKAIDKDLTTIELDLTGYPSGTYFVQLYSNRVIASEKLILAF